MSPREHQNKLKVGLLINSYKLSLWEYILIDRIIQSHYASINLVVTNQNNKVNSTFMEKIKDRWKHLVFIFYNRFDQRFFKVKPNAFELKDAVGLLDGVANIFVNPTSKSFSDSFKNEDIQKIKIHNLDVLIRFGFRILKGDILEAAKYGVWSYHHGDSNINRGAPSGFWEVFENKDITGSTLQILSKDLDAGKILYQSFSSTNRTSVNRNRNNCYWKSLSFLPRKLEELYDVGGVEFLNRVDNYNKYPIFYSDKLYSIQNTSNWTMLKLIATHWVRLLGNKFVSLFSYDQWTLFFAFGEDISTSFWKFKTIQPPKDRFFADPFIVFENKKYYIFIEEFINKFNKGRISVIQMDENGNYEDPIPIIDLPYHLSFPCIIKHKKDFFLIPESRSNNTIELYKCIEFPLKWKFCTNLMEGVEAVDTILFHYKNKWWLFTNIVENKGSSSLDELFLFYSEDLFSKTWTPHVKNPIVSDVRKARSAGNIFIHNGMILRPSQDNSKKYGYGMKMNEIRVLNENEYEEIEVGAIQPNWNRKVIATHTFNSAGNLTLIDGVVRRKFFDINQV
jgi:folate-dependent phosphoribosylglycinamide formyltransferase PurN